MFPLCGMVSYNDHTTIFPFLDSVIKIPLVWLWLVLNFDGLESVLVVVALPSVYFLLF